MSVAFIHFITVHNGSSLVRQEGLFLTHQEHPCIIWWKHKNFSTPFLSKFHSFFHLERRNDDEKTPFYPFFNFTLHSDQRQALYFANLDKYFRGFYRFLIHLSRFPNDKLLNLELMKFG